jgi:eukaryotic-like serine/threonine-protein kinase
MTSLGPVYEFGPYRLSASERILLRGGEPARLTPKVFDLLLYLVRNAGRVVTKDELMEAVWPGTFVEEANLTQSVFTLRRALGEREDGAQYVETISKKGYRFASDIREVREAPRSFRQLTFGRGPVHAARFTRDPRVVAYDAAWEGGPLEIYSTDTLDPGPRALGLTGSGLLAVSGADELAVSLRRRFLRGYVHSGTLARLPLAGGAPREVLDEAQWADWSPRGNELAVVRDAAGRNRLEYPVGKVLYETGGWVSHPRVSPAGDQVAFIDHPVLSDDSGTILVVDLAGDKRVLSEGWISAQGLAWSPAGDEVWFTAAGAGNARALHAVALDGRRRLVEAMAGSTTLHDVGPGGRVLITRDTTRLGIISLAPGGGRERELAWQDWSLARDLSADGEWLLFTEAGEASGAAYAVYLRRTDGSAPVRLGEGSALALSPDGAWALVRLSERQQLALLPTKAGEPRLLEQGPLTYLQWACWFPDGERILFAANEAGRGTRLYTQKIAGGPPRRLTNVAEGAQLTTPHAVSPDGWEVAAVGPDHEVCLYSVEGGAGRGVGGAERGDMPVRWSPDGRQLYVRQRGEVPAKLYRVDLSSGGREFWRELMPRDPAGVYEILRVLLTPDGSSYAYTYTRDFSDLYLAEGLK